ncbi:MAG: acyltransferase [Robiginitomaculum sp.]|nr:MAG: acyltransferase [Robiginitomaculum sp.]
MTIQSSLFYGMAFARFAAMRTISKQHRPVSGTHTLADALDQPHNLLTPVRLLMALGVLLGHSFVVFLGNTGPEPLILFDITISYAAVNGFFILSGLLITRSFDRRPDVVRFIVARALRLFPALIVLSLVAVMIFGPLFSSLGLMAYFSDLSVWRYLCDVLTFGDTSGGPPQIFPNNPWAGEFSASLWTLRFEVIAYGGSLILGLLGLSRSRTRVLGVFVLSVLAFMAVRVMPADMLPAPFMDLTRLSMAYLLGATLYAWRDCVRISGRLALGVTALALLFGPTASYEIMLNFALAAGVLMVGFGLPVRFAPLARIPDLSYGIYIWQWPVMQSLYHLGMASNPFIMMMLSLPISALIAAASWYSIEKPALAYKTPLANWVLSRVILSRKTA